MANYNAPWNKGLVGSERVKLSEETKRKMSVSHTGSTKPTWVKNKIRDSNFGKHNTKITCSVCGLVGGRSIMKRWHFENCGTRDRTEFQRYRRLVDYSTTELYRNFSHIINPNNHPRTRCGILGGYQLDHKVSVKEGFDRKLPIHEIAHINNLQMLSWQENRHKGV